MTLILQLDEVGEEGSCNIEDRSEFRVALGRHEYGAQILCDRLCAFFRPQGYLVKVLRSLLHLHESTSRKGHFIH